MATGNNPGGAPLQPAYILHRRNYGNSSLLLECFTPAGGRFPAIARGASARFSKGASMPQPFQPFWLKLAGRGEVRTLAACEAAAGPAPLQGERLYCAFYLNELLLRLLPRDDPHALLFDRYAQTLTELSDGVAADLLRRFEVALLQALGYGAPLHLEASGGRPPPCGRSAAGPVSGASTSRTISAPVSAAARARPGRSPRTDSSTNNTPINTPTLTSNGRPIIQRPASGDQATNATSNTPSHASGRFTQGSAAAAASRNNPSTDRSTSRSASHPVARCTPRNSASQPKLWSTV